MGKSILCIQAPLEPAGTSGKGGPSAGQFFLKSQSRSEGQSESWSQPVTAFVTLLGSTIGRGQYGAGTLRDTASDPNAQSCPKAPMACTKSVKSNIIVPNVK